MSTLRSAAALHWSSKMCKYVWIYCNRHDCFQRLKCSGSIRHALYVEPIEPRHFIRFETRGPLINFYSPAMSGFILVRSVAVGARREVSTALVQS